MMKSSSGIADSLALPQIESRVPPNRIADAGSCGRTRLPPYHPPVGFESFAVVAGRISTIHRAVNTLARTLDYASSVPVEFSALESGYTIGWHADFHPSDRIRKS